MKRLANKAVSTLPPKGQTKEDSLSVALVLTEPIPSDAPPIEEILSSSLLRAEAEHALRVAECSRKALMEIVGRTIQPCLAFSREGKIVVWNSALWACTALLPQQVLGKEVSEVLRPHLLHQLERLGLWEKAAPYLPKWKEPFALEGPLPLVEGFTAQHLQFLPLFHVPDCLEAVFVLVEPHCTHGYGD